MRDSVSFLRAKLLHPYISNEVIATITAIEVAKFSPYMAIRLPQCTRTFPEQADIYALGRTKRNPDGYDPVKKPLGNIVTRSKPGQSYHNYGLAIDFAILYDKDKNGTFEKLSWDLVEDLDRDGEADWMEVVETFEALQYTWGGHFSNGADNPHLEKHKGIHWTILLDKLNRKDFIPGTNFVNI